jgi:hypothetical protein
MEESQRELLSRLEQLQSGLDELRARLSVVEAAVGLPRTSVAPVSDAVPAAEDVIVAAGPQAGAVAPLFGWAFLGLSGAYLLRAATESGTVPAPVGVIVGILYSGWWLFLAATRAWSKPLASTVYALTAVLVMAPLLWEATIRFHVLTATTASLVLVAFTAFGLAIGWRHNLTSVAWVATLTGLLTPMALFRETHDGHAWAMSVLAVAAAVEFSACRDHWLGLRWVAAGAADLTIFMLTVLATTRADNPAIATAQFVLGSQVALLGIYLASTADRTLIRKLPITTFEIGQAAVAFVVSVGGALHLAEATSLGWIPVGFFCLAAGTICYAISFAMLDRDTHASRNFYTYSTFGLLLTIAGCRLLIAGDAVAIAWSLLAVCMLLAGLGARRKTLELHAVVSLVLATLAAGAIQKAWVSLMFAPHAAQPGISPSYLAVLISALLMYGAVVVFELRANITPTRRVASFVSAAVFSWSTAGVAAVLASHVAVASAPLRTALLTLLAVASAGLGMRARRTELLWLAYSFVFGAGVKLFAEDFRTGNSLGLVVSLTLFGITLIVLPRLLRMSRTQIDNAGRTIATRAGT